MAHNQLFVPFVSVFLVKFSSCFAYWDNCHTHIVYHQGASIPRHEFLNRVLTLRLIPAHLDYNGFVTVKKDQFKISILQTKLPPCMVTLFIFQPEKVSLCTDYDRCTSTEKNPLTYLQTIHVRSETFILDYKFPIPEGFMYADPVMRQKLCMRYSFVMFKVPSLPESSQQVLITWIRKQVPIRDALNPYENGMHVIIYLESSQTFTHLSYYCRKFTEVSLNWNYLTTPRNQMISDIAKINQLPKTWRVEISNCLSCELKYERYARKTHPYLRTRDVSNDPELKYYILREITSRTNDTLELNGRRFTSNECDAGYPANIFIEGNVHETHLLFGFMLTNYVDQVVFTKVEGHKFITCYAEKRLSFQSYLDPFDKSLWIFLLISILTFGILLIVTPFSYDAHDKTSRSRISPVASYYMIMASLLEQSVNDHPLFRRSSKLMWVICGWNLLTLLIPNAYKGLAITGLVAPLPGYTPDYCRNLSSRRYSCYFMDPLCHNVSKRWVVNFNHFGFLKNLKMHMFVFFLIFERINIHSTFFIY